MARQRLLPNMVAAALRNLRLLQPSVLTCLCDLASGGLDEECQNCGKAILETSVINNNTLLNHEHAQIGYEIREVVFGARDEEAG